MKGGSSRVFLEGFGEACMVVADGDWRADCYISRLQRERLRTVFWGRDLWLLFSRGLGVGGGDGVGGDTLTTGSGWDGNWQIVMSVG